VIPRRNPALQSGEIARQHQFSNTGDVFLPFTSTKKSTGNNLGLGLSVSYGIVRKHGGSISAANNEKGGCEFTLRFPVEGLGQKECDEH
jgi:K+-sensing histidine kinase KdpD